MSRSTVQVQHALHEIFAGMTTEITFGQGIMQFICEQSVSTARPEFYRAVDSGAVATPAEVASWVCSNVPGVVEVRVTTPVGPGAIARRIPKGV